MILKTRSLYSLVAIIILSALFLFLQYSNVFSIQGIQPNVILIFPLLLLFREKGAIPFWVSLFSLLFFSYILFPMWIGPVLLSVLLCGVVFFLKPFFTGNRFLDFLGIIAFLTLIFLLVLYAFHWEDRSISVLLGSVVYNTGGGSLLWLLSSRFSFS